MTVFVIGDVHGCHGALLQCLDRCGFDNARDTLISLGDIVDGGPDSFECVEELLKLKIILPLRVITMIGYWNLLKRVFIREDGSMVGLLLLNLMRGTQVRFL